MKPAVVAKPDEAAKVLDWRVHECLVLGYGVRDSERIARSTADLGVLRKLIAGGCELTTAKKIVV